MLAQQQQVQQEHQQLRFLQNEVQGRRWRAGRRLLKPSGPSNGPHASIHSSIHPSSTIHPTRSTGKNSNSRNKGSPPPRFLTPSDAPTARCTASDCTHCPLHPAHRPRKHTRSEHRAQSTEHPLSADGLSCPLPDPARRRLEPHNRVSDPRFRIYLNHPFGVPNRAVPCSNCHLHPAFTLFFLAHRSRV